MENIVINMIINMKFDKKKKKKIMKWSPFVHLYFERAGVFNLTLNDFCYNYRTT